MYSSKPRIIPDESSAYSGDGSPPETPDSVRFDALAEEGGSGCALDLEGCFEGVDWREGNAKGGSTCASLA